MTYVNQLLVNFDVENEEETEDDIAAEKIREMVRFAVCNFLLRLHVFFVFKGNLALPKAPRVEVVGVIVGRVLVLVVHLNRFPQAITNRLATVGIDRGVAVGRVVLKNSMHTTT